MNLPIATQITARLLGHDLVSVKPMSAPKGYIFYDYKYKETEEERRARIKKDRKEKLDRLRGIKPD